jgi:hypothetical protein
MIRNGSRPRIGVPDVGGAVHLAILGRHLSSCEKWRYVFPGYDLRLWDARTATSP